jgi:hypothetical protein
MNILQKQNKQENEDEEGERRDSAAHFLGVSEWVPWKIMRQ